MNETSAGPSLDELIGELAEEFSQRVRNGEDPCVEEYVRRYPQVGDQLRRILPALALVAETPAVSDSPEGQSSDAFPAPQNGTLGDFRLLREIGRGGMGVVYEAEQISLSRHVALKILPFASVLDQRQIQRFKNEALAAAQLDHPHIVDVYGVGCERSVHFYAMRFVEGDSLADVIGQLRTLARPEPGATSTGNDPNAVTVLQGSGSARGGSRAATHTAASSAAGNETVPVAALSTQRTATGREYFRTVARIGIEIAGALDHAHQHGVIHRDVKPANIIIDRDGKSWVTDFGLAHTESGAALTMTGDLLGTLRYMSPEQALSKRVVVDHRTDVYSLGVTLYELLTLRPAYPEEDRHELLRKIASEDPKPPRKLNGSVPGALETIVLKAISKNPNDRYETAQELADDLQRYRDDKPIRAKRPGPVQIATQWTRRHSWAVGLTTLTTVLVLLAVVLGLALANRSIIRQRNAALENLYVAQIRQAMSDWESNNVARMKEVLQSHLEDPVLNAARGWEWYFLNSLCHKQERTLYGHSTGVMSTAWSPDGRRLASGDANGTVKIWDAATGNQILSLESEFGEVNDLQWSPDGESIVAGYANATAVVWDALRGEQRRILRGHDSNVLCVAWSPDGTRIATGSRHLRPVIVWDAATGEIVSTPGTPGLFDAQNKAQRAAGLPFVRAMTWSKDGAQLIWVLDSSDMVFWDIEGTRAIRRFEYDGFRPRSMHISSDGLLLAVSAWHGVRTWRVDRDPPEAVIRTKHGGLIRCIRWRPGAKQFATASADNTVRIFDAETHAEQVVLRGHASDVRDIDWSPDGRRLASASDDGTVKVWVPEEARAWKDEPGRMRAAWSPDSLRVVTPLGELIQVREASSGRLIRDLGKCSNPRGLDWSPDGRRVAAFSKHKNLLIWDAKTGELLLDAPSPGVDNRCVTWNPDNRHVATSGYSGTIEIWDTSSGKVIAQLDGRRLQVGSVQWSPDGRQLASASWDQKVIIWDVAQLAVAQQRFVFDRTEGVPRGGGENADAQVGLAWSPEGNRLVAGSASGNIFVWDTATGAELLRMRGHSSGVHCVCWSPDGRRIASGGGDKTIRIWDAITGRELLVIEAHDHGLQSLRWSPNGQSLVSADGSTVKLWEATGYKPP